MLAFRSVGDEWIGAEPLAPVSRSLDPELILVLVDVADRLVVGRPGFFAKNTLADFKISFARLSSASSRLSRRFSSTTSVVGPDFNTVGLILR